MTATLEQIGELRTSVRYIQAGIDRVEARQDRAMSKLEEVLAELRQHLVDDATQFGRVDQKIELQGADIRKEMAVAMVDAKAEQRGVNKATHLMHAAVMTAIAFLAGLGGGHVKIPGMH